MKSVSNKEAGLQRSLKNVYSQIDERAHDEENFCCWSCGSHQMLSHSHILGRDLRKDLMCEPGNIILQCDECHEAWEKRTWKKIVKFRNLRYILHYIEENDDVVFWAVIEGVNEHIDQKKLGI